MSGRIVLCWALVVASACSGEDMSVGELRCYATRCSAPSNRSDRGGASLPTEQLAEVPGTLVWKAEHACPREHGCSQAMVPGSNAWTVHADGAVSTAQAYAAYDESHVTTSSILVISHFGPDGTLLWQNDDIERPGYRIGTFSAVALTESSDDTLTVAWSGLEPDRLLGVSRLDIADGRSTLMFESPSGTLPDALTWVDGDLWVAGYSNWDPLRNPEVSRYRPNGELVWRQSMLRNDEHTAKDSQTASGLQLARDKDGHPVVASPFQSAYSFARLDRDGSIASWTYSWSDWSDGSGAPATPDLTAKLSLDADGRAAYGVSGPEGYAVYRCEDEPCTSFLSVHRGREAYYPPALRGLTIDEESRVYVLTHDGLYSEPRVLIDRYSPGLSQRETFVLEGEERPAIWVNDEHRAGANIALGPDGDVYYVDHREIGRIKLGAR